MQPPPLSTHQTLSANTIRPPSLPKPPTRLPCGQAITMAAMQDSGQQDNLSLEARMRNLIIKNAAQTQAQSTAADVPRSSTQPFVPSITEDASASPSQQDSQGQPKPSQKPGRKRMNQAQRRQMSSQLSVDIDPRATGPQPSQTRGQSTGNQQRPGHNHQGRNYRSRSAAFQSPYVNTNHGRHQPSPSLPAFAPQPTLFDWRQPGGHSNAFNGAQPGFSRPNHASRNSTSQVGPSYNHRPFYPRAEDLRPQVALLERLSADILANAEIAFEQIQEKENFRLLIEDACRVAITRHERMVNGQAHFPPLSVQLRCFGSLSSGFATKSSDMDLGLLSPYSQPEPDNPDSPIPRIIEKTFLEMGIGARLLVKTRVPIIKVCQKPTEKLYSDLVEERQKWEKGFEEEHEPEDDEGEHRSAAVSGEQSHQTGNASADDLAGNAGDSKMDGSTAGTRNDEPGIGEYQALLDELKQGAKSLPNYYGAAKKTLRRLGGKDITNSTVMNFSKENFRILNDVCQAFVKGLADDTLRDRLQGYASLAFDQQAAVPNNRSIFGVMAQIEGEKLIMAFESRTILERNDHCEQLARNRVAHWRELQNRPNFGLDPLGYNKDLLSATEYLKKIPSIGLLLLEQGQHESAASYHNRAVRLLTDLGGHDLPSSQSPVFRVVLSQYSQGIYDFAIRAQVSDWLKSNPSTTLRTLARRHKSLQLAREFEKALEQGLYSSEAASDVRAYIGLLRGPMGRISPEGAHHDSILPVSPDHVALVARIRKISDPSRMSPNLPRDPYRDKLEFPSSGIGVQCDINFSAQLAIHNTHLLRCYSLTDARVRPLVLFVKHWAKVRGINTSYRGTLSSYGYVLMVLHYLINVAEPFVCPNLQVMAPPVDTHLRADNTTVCQGRYVWFWKNEDEIQAAAKQGRLTQNKDSIGHLLRGFFEYYAQGNMMTSGNMRGFDWGRDVISLRTPGGILSKQTKGWTGAKTVLEVQSADKPPAVEPEMPQANPVPGPEAQCGGNSVTAPQLQQSQDTAVASRGPQERSKHEVKEVRHRYLFAIEDPFEWDHNVARTVTHNGIVAIRDEFRRAWRIIRGAGKCQHQENLLQDSALDVQAELTSFAELIDELHGPQPAQD
jgi:terminal uridylyltransferase